MSNSLPSSGVGRFTSVALGLVVFLCLTLIGASGYLKYQLDRSEAVLAAPDAALAADQGASDRLRRSLGYSGFMGSAQNFLATHDHAALADMKAQMQTAQDVLAHLPEKTPSDARRDLQSILNVFSAARQKAELSTTDPSVSFTAADMAPLYAALPVLNERSQSAMATGRFAAQADLKLWATLLTLVAWISLIAAAALAAGVYLSLRGHNAAPFRALAQSVQNMARGDMRTPIWGMERQDMVGDLARAIDLARYHFSQLPDLSLLSEQGPVRIRFEGQARSLFEAMMQNIARDSEGIRAQASTLADAVNQQKEAVADVARRIEAALGSMYNERQSSEQQVRQLLQTVAGSAQTLHGSQATVEAQLSHLVAYLEERAKGMAEVTQIAGKQVAQTLQSLTHTEHNLRASAEQNQLTVRKLASSTDELGERLFGAVSLLRAGGKVLTETAEATQSRLNEAINLLSQSEGSLRQMLVQGFEPVGHPALALPAVARDGDTGRLQTVVDGLEAAQRKLEECLAQQAEAAGAQIELLATHGNNLLTQASATAQTLATVTDHLRNEQNRLGETGSRFADVLENIGGRLEQRVMESLSRAEITLQGLNRLSDLTGQLGTMVERLNALESASDSNEGASSGNLLVEVKTGFEVTTRSLERLREEFIGAALHQSSLPSPGSSVPAAAAAAGAQWDRILEQIGAANESLAGAIAQQADRIETRLSAMDKKIAGSVGGMSPEEAQTQLQQQAQVLSELASALGAIDTHMQEMQVTFKNFERPSSDGGRMAS